MSELEPCLFCGGEDIYSGYCEAAGVWEVQCNECGARRFGVKRKDEAEARWNTRHERTCCMVYREGAPACSECGRELECDSRFCDCCGAEVVDA